MLSMRWRIQDRAGPRDGSVLRAWRRIVALHRCAACYSKSRPA
jgi:hypothetical protein